MRLFQPPPVVSRPAPSAESAAMVALRQAIREELERGWRFWHAHCIEPASPSSSSSPISSPKNPHVGRTLVPNLFHPHQGRRAGANSEYQSFSMLFALCVDDRSTFDAAWQWTRRHLQTRPGDKLLWWVAYDTGEIGRGTASDGELGCMHALLLAAERWQVPVYRQQALAMAAAFRQHCVTEIAGRLVIAAGANDPASRDFWSPRKGLVCFSNYLMIHPLRVLARAQPDQDWQRLLADSLALLRQAETLYGHGLPPETFRVRFSDGTLLPASSETPPWNSYANVSSCRYLSFLMMDAAQGGAESQAYLARFDRLEAAYAKAGTLPWGWRDGQTWGPDGWPLLAVLAAKRALAGDTAMADTVFRQARRLWRAQDPTQKPGEYMFNHACAMLALIPLSGLMPASGQAAGAG